MLHELLSVKERQIAKSGAKRGTVLPPVDKEQWPYKLPRGWEFVRLGNALNMYNGRAFKPTEWTLSGLPIVRIQNLNTFHAPFNFCSAGDIEDRHRIDTDSFLISWSGTPGTSFGAFIWKRGPAALNQHIFRCEQVSHVFNPEFLRLAINSQLHVLISQAHGGVGLQHVTKGVLENLPISLPPLAEQHRIVVRVEELMKLCDALEARGRLADEQHARLTATLFDALAASGSARALAENWQHIAEHFDLLLDRPESINALEQTILQLAVRGRLVAREHGDSEWVETTMGAALEFLNGYAFKSEWFRSSGLPVVRNINVAHGSIAWSDKACVDESRAEEFKRFALSVGDLLISLDRPIISTGLKYAVVRQQDLPCLLLQRVAKMTPRGEAISTEYLRLWLISPDFIGNIDPGRSNGVPHISTRQLEAIPIRLPSLAEQHRIVARVAEVRYLCGQLRLRLTSARFTQSELAEALVQTVTN